MGPNNNNVNTGMYEPQGRMNHPPNVITTKDLSYLTDSMAWELLAAKKCHMYASMCTTPAVQQEITQIGQMHQQHFDRLLQHMQSNPNQSVLSGVDPMTIH